MKSLHTTPDGEAMLELIDKLRGIQGLPKQIDLPQIVVAGQQSSGKSSVLNAISGIRFPTYHALCTQFPTEIRLRRGDRQMARAYIKDVTGPEFETFERNWSDIAPEELESQLPTIIDAARKLLIRQDNVAKVSTKSLVIQVSGPKLDHLTLVDLPGLFAATLRQQHTSDIAAIEKMITGYIDQPLSIVLAVVTAADDPQNHKILQIIRDQPHRAPKTLGVLTKPDLLQGNDDDQERSRAKLLTDDDWGLGYGWHVVRNLRPNEIVEGADRDAFEEKFFRGSEAWKRGRESRRVGNAALKEKLSSILRKNIAQSMPDIELQIHCELERVESALDRLGLPRLSANEQINYLQEQARSLRNEPPLLAPSSPILLRSCLEKLYQQFVHDFHVNGAVWKLNSAANAKSAGPRAVRDAISSRQNTTALVSQEDLTSYLEELNSNNPTKILPNLVPHQWSVFLFQQQRARWLGRAQQFINQAFSFVEQAVSIAASEIILEDAAKLEMKRGIGTRLSERKKQVDQKLRELHRPYDQPQLSCYMAEYKRQVYESKPDPENGSVQIQDILRSTDIYYNIASGVFVENVIQLAVEACLVDRLDDLLSPGMILSWDDDAISRLGGESEGNRTLRERYSTDLIGLREAHGLMLDFRARVDLHASGVMLNMMLPELKGYMQNTKYPDHTEAFTSPTIDPAPVQPPQHSRSRVLKRPKQKTWHRMNNC